MIWLCHDEGTWLGYPVLHHSEGLDLPAEHNDRCGWYSQVRVWSRGVEEIPKVEGQTEISDFV